MDIKEEYTVIITDMALKEITDIYTYISERLFATKAAEDLMEKLEKSILRLEFYPDRYAVEYKYSNDRTKYHRIVIDNFLILYSIDCSNKQVYISHMFYGGSNYLSKI